jgi:hypothetical protein
MKSWPYLRRGPHHNATQVTVDPTALQARLSGACRVLLDRQLESLRNGHERKSSERTIHEGLRVSNDAILLTRLLTKAPQMPLSDSLSDLFCMVSAEGIEPSTY